MSGRWFHCGRCGHLFEGAPDERCPECGRVMVVDEAEFAFEEARREAQVKQQIIDERRKNTSSPKLRQDPTANRLRGLLTFAGLWVVFLALLVGFIAWFRGTQEEGPEQMGETVIESVEDAGWINDVYHECFPVIDGFARKSGAESRYEYVHGGPEVLAKMARSSVRAPVLAEGEKIKSGLFKRFESPAGPAIQSVWEMPGEKRLEVVFYEKGGEWKIDWENLVRHSSEPWSVFLSGNGPSVGEFRVLARRRTGEGGSRGDVSRLMLLEPMPWMPGRAGSRSPGIQVDPESDMGRRLKRAFARMEAGEGAFDTQLSEKDPKGMIRIRAKLRRSEEKNEDGKWDFTIEKLYATHWLSVDEERSDDDF